MGRILSVLIIFFLAISVLGQLFFPEHLIDIVGARVFIVGDTGSMMPELQYRDLIVVRQFDFDSLEIGDYVTFRSQVYLQGEQQDIFVTHKVIGAVEGNGYDALAYRTSGIHPDIGPDRRLMTIDGLNNTNQFLGKYVFRISIPQGIRAFLMSVPGVIAITVNFICMVLIGLLIIDDEIPENYINST